VPEAVQRRKISWVISLMTVSCLLAVVASSITVFMAVTLIRQNQTQHQRHDKFCAFLSTEIQAAQAHPALEPLLPGLLAEHINNACS